MRSRSRPEVRPYVANRNWYWSTLINAQRIWKSRSLTMTPGTLHGDYVLDKHGGPLPPVSIRFVGECRPHRYVRKLLLDLLKRNQSLEVTEMRRVFPALRIAEQEHCGKRAVR